MTSSLVSFAAAGDVPELHENHLPWPHFVYGLLGLAFFAVMLLVLWSFRNTAQKAADQRHDGKSEH